MWTQAATAAPASSGGSDISSRPTCGCSLTSTTLPGKALRRRRKRRRHARRRCSRWRSRSDAAPDATFTLESQMTRSFPAPRAAASGARLAAALTVMLALACSPGDAPQGGAGSSGSAPAGLTGAGATFPNPIYTKWFDAYHRQTGVQINYQSIGSGGGIRQFTEGTVDFGATDGPMTDEQIAASGKDVLHIPTVLGADVVTYNLPSLGQTRLKLDGPLIADIFMGRITRWNDPRIAALNPGVALPDEAILVVHRSDGSGTTFIFTDYLSKVSPEWKAQVGSATSVSWPTGLGGKGNEGVTQQVKQNR